MNNDLPEDGGPYNSRCTGLSAPQYEAKLAGREKTK
jgi:hypothetical protein